MAFNWYIGRTNIGLDECKVQTMGRLTQWIIRNLDYSHPLNYPPCNIAMQNWDLTVKKGKEYDDSHITLHPEMSEENTNNLQAASFIIQVFTFAGKNRKVLTRSVIKDMPITRDGFAWEPGFSLPESFIIEFELLDLKSANPSGEDACSIWLNGFKRQKLNATTLESFGRMLREGIHTDITINVDSSERSIKAHRPVLAARSPVFRGMFSHNFKENDSSIINILDMSFEAFHAFINYIYGTIKDEEFMSHRLALLHAADKYDIQDLREACHESLQEDISIENVLERFQSASLYQLPELKSSCMQYLVKFGKIFDIWDDFTTFLQSADKDQLCEIIYEILHVWERSQGFY